MPRKAVTLHLDAEVLSGLEKWAADELRSLDTQVELALREALARAGRSRGGATKKHPYR
jgi:hypothetical protein